MTPNRRIFLNIVATYGQSLYALVIGLWRLLSSKPMACREMGYFISASADDHRMDMSQHYEMLIDE